MCLSTNNMAGSYHWLRFNLKLKPHHPQDDKVTALPSATLAFRRDGRPSHQRHAQLFLNLKMTPKIHMFLLTWLLTKQVTGLTEPSILDMAPNAFDDQYEGCVQEMEKKAPQLLKEDFNMSEQLRLEWERAEEKWKDIKNTRSYPEGFHDFHGTALVAYTGDIHKDFNRAVREFRKDFHNFHYKAFHYYLTRALQLLNNKSCYTVYRGTKNKYYYSGKGSVRFGQFASSTSAKAVAVSKSFLSDHGTLFRIETCLGVDIKEFSFLSIEKEVLIPGYEEYHKVIVTQIEKGYDEISLDSPQRKKSNFNCFYSGLTNIANSHLRSSGARVSPAFLLLVVLPGLLVQLFSLAEL